MNKREEARVILAAARLIESVEHDIFTDDPSYAAAVKRVDRAALDLWKILLRLGTPCPKCGHTNPPHLKCVRCLETTQHPSLAR